MPHGLRDICSVTEIEVSFKAEQASFFICCELREFGECFTLTRKMPLKLDGVRRPISFFSIFMPDMTRAS
jgi:hypothetical protein